MDLTPLHPKVVHIPIALAALMPLVTAGLALAWWRQWLPRRAWLLAVALQLILVGGAFAAMQTGEAEEDVVEHVVGHDALHVHEEAAEVFAWGAVAALALIAGAALVRNEAAARVVAAVSVAGAIAVLALGVRVGEAGGALVYQHGAANAYMGQGGRATDEAARPGGRDHDDGDHRRDRHDDD